MWEEMEELSGADRVKNTEGRVAACGHRVLIVLVVGHLNHFKSANDP